MPNPFTDFVIATKPKRIPSKNKIVHSCTTQRTLFSAEAFANTEAHQMLQTGEHIFDLVQLDEFNGATGYTPYDNIESQEPAVLSKIKAPWRQSISTWNYSEEVMELNRSEEAWTRYVDAHRMAAEQGFYKYIESQLLADPDPEMESKETFEGTRWYSLFAFLTSDGAAPTAFTSAGVNTVMGQNPAEKPAWKNVGGSDYTYAAAQYDETIWSAFWKMRQALNWDIPSVKDWIENSDFRKMVIYTDEPGELRYVNYCNNRANRFYDTDDTAPLISPKGGAGVGLTTAGPRFFNILIKRQVGLNAKGWTNPNYLWVDWKYMDLVLHSAHFMKEHDPKDDPYKRGVKRVDSTLWGNLFCRDRSRHGWTAGA